MSKSICSACGATFPSVSSFDLHRTGSFLQGTRRCLRADEMRARGMVRNEKGWWMRASFADSAVLGALRSPRSNAAAQKAS
jgi:hypothetical protein